MSAVPNDDRDSAFLRRLAAKAAEADERIEDAGPSLKRVEDDPRADAMLAYFHASLAESGSGHFASASLDDLAPDQHPMVLRRFLAGLEQGQAALRQLLLAGPTSRGKTHAAVALGNAAARLGMTVRFVDHLTYLQWLRPEGSDKPDWKIEKRFREPDVVILNDVGAEFDPTKPASEFRKTNTLRLVDDRLYTPGKVTIYTTNERAAIRDDDGRLVGGLELMLGDRFLERLGEQGNALRFAGANRRGKRLDF